ncbi:MAG TPA: PQQ-binding-like beta-propeller repeat protein [Gemmataceae bacterium]|nr:PQQ-binding-like beta-propeller repeat protein [Gemmataceae bacterium]
MPLGPRIIVAFVAAAASLFLPAAVPARADKAADWPQLLGPQRNGISGETGLNLDWKANPPRTVWKKSIGAGFSSVAVVGDRVVTQTQRDDRQWVVCLSTKDGEQLWAYDAAPGYIDRQHAGGGPRSTPTVDGDRVYCLFPRGELVCVTLAKGEEVWKTNIFDAAKAKDHFQDFYYWGVSQSPLVEGDVVIVQPGGEKDGSVVAFDKSNGHVVWSVGSDPAGYGSPIAIDIGKKRMIVCPTGQSVLGIDPVKGELLWRYAFGNFANATCATPVWSGDLLFVSAAYGTGCAALEIKQDGDKWAAQPKWSNKDLQTLMATGIGHDGCIYGCHGDLGAWTLRCMDLKTGEIKWKERLSSRCSFVSAEGCLFGWTENGSVRLIELNSDKYVLKGELADLTAASRAWAMPALCNKRLYVRAESDLFCLDLDKQ